MAIKVESKSPLERIKELDEEKARLMQEAKSEAMNRVNSALGELNALGFSYRLIEASRSARAAADGGRKGTRQVNPERPCPICGFQTVPPHDARRHRGQEVKRPFTAEQLTAIGLSKA